MGQRAARNVRAARRGATRGAQRAEREAHPLRGAREHERRDARALRRLAHVQRRALRPLHERLERGGRAAVRGRQALRHARVQRAEQRLGVAQRGVRQPGVQPLVQRHEAQQERQRRRPSPRFRLGEPHGTAPGGRVRVRAAGATASIQRVEQRVDGGQRDLRLCRGARRRDAGEKSVPNRAELALLGQRLRRLAQQLRRALEREHAAVRHVGR